MTLSPEDLEQKLIGPSWHQLSCGCRLKVYVRFPHNPRILTFNYTGHDVRCDAHSESPETFSRKVLGERCMTDWWLIPVGMHVLRKLSMKRFRRVWEAYPVKLKEASTTNPHDYYIRTLAEVLPGSCRTCRIYRTGHVLRV